MSKLIFSYDQHYELILQAIKKNPKRVLIASFGLFYGLLPNGSDMADFSKAKLYTREVMEALAKVTNDVKILVGIPNYISCYKYAACLDCEIRYVEQAIRLLNHVAKFPNFQYKMTKRSHMKAILFGYGDSYKSPSLGIVGGRNFTNSDFSDISVALTGDDVQSVWEATQGIWDNALDINDKTISSVLEEESISMRAIEKIFG